MARAVGTAPGAPGGRMGCGAAGPARPPDTYRSALALVAWWVWLAFAVANLIDLAVQGRDRTSAEAAAVLLLVTGIAYAAALRPRVIATDDGIVVRNPLRDHRLPWAIVTDVDLRDLLRVHCAWRASPRRGPGQPEGPGGPNTPNKGHGLPTVPGPEIGQRTRAVHAWAIQSPRRAGMVSGLRPAFGRDDLARRSVGGRTAAAEPPSAVHRKETERIARALTERARRERADAAARAPGPGTVPRPGAVPAPGPARGRAAASGADEARGAPGAEAGVMREAPGTVGARPVSAWHWPAVLAIVVPALLLVTAIFA